MYTAKAYNSLPGYYLSVGLLFSFGLGSALTAPGDQESVAPATTLSAIVRASISEDYAPYDGPKLSSIAAQVSQNTGFEGIKQLLTLLGEQQEIVGLQHLLLQLRVVHEWLCIASEQDATKGMAELEGAFKVMASLNEWFVKCFNHLRQGGSWHTGTGQKLLDLLKGSLQNFDSVIKHAPHLLQLLRGVAQDESVAVRKAALLLLADPPAAWASEASSIILELLKGLDPYAGRATLRMLLSLSKWCSAWTADALYLIRSSLQDSYAYVRREALETLSTLAQVAPEQSEAAFEAIRNALKDTNVSVRFAALKALSTLIQAVPKHAEAALEIIQSALQNQEDSIRAAALRALSSLVKVDPERSEAAFAVIQKALEDEKGSVRSAALGALSTLLQIAPGQSEAALEIIQSALQDQEHSVRAAALRTLSTLLQVAPDRAQAALGIIRSALQGDSQGVGEASFGALSTLAKEAPTKYQAAFGTIQTALQDGPWRTCLAALKALVALVEVAPEQSEEVFKIIQELLKDKDPDIREMTLDVLPKLVQVAPRWAQYALQLILSALQDAHDNVRKAAFRFMERSSLEQLLEYYWTTPDSRLIPYMTPRLYHTPLVVSNSGDDDDQQVTLYTTEGTSFQWLQPQEATNRFVALVKDEASQKPWIPSDKSGKRVWEQYFGAVGEEPALPADIREIMDSPCPFWEGKRVKDTHLLALIPSHVAGQPLTLDYLGQLIKSPQGEGHGTQYAFYWDTAGEAIGSQASGSSYGVLMTRDVLLGSRWGNYAAQCALVSNHANRTGISYEVPRALEASVVMLLHHVRSGERLYSDNPLTYTYCQEEIEGYPLIVGEFFSGGLFVSPSIDADGANGAAGLRKF